LVFNTWGNLGELWQNIVHWRDEGMITTGCRSVSIKHKFLRSEGTVNLSRLTVPEKSRGEQAKGLLLISPGTPWRLFGTQHYHCSSLVVDRCHLFLKKKSIFFSGQFRPTLPVYARRVNSLLLVCSLSSHRHSYIPLIFGSRFIDS
jgi:hypothetical protein